MSPKDRRRFGQSYNELCVGCQHRLKREEHAIEEVVYFRALAEFSIESVETAAHTWARCGSGWFPKTAQWYAMALDDEVRRMTRRPVANLLGPVPVELQADLHRIARARDAVVAKCREMGWTGVAALIARLPIRHPSTNREVPHCAACEDTGFALRLEADGRRHAVTCACLATNPVIKLRRYEAWLEQRVVQRPMGGAGTRSLPPQGLGPVGRGTP